MKAAGSHTRARPTVAATRRTTDDRVVAGVCGGLGERLRIDPVGLRVVFVLSAVVWGLGAIAYGLLWWRLPEVDAPTTNGVRPLRTRSLALSLGSAALVAAGVLMLRSTGVLPPDLFVLPGALAAIGVTLVWGQHPLRPLQRTALPGVGNKEAEPPEVDPDAGPEEVLTEKSDSQGRVRRSQRVAAPFGSTTLGGVLVVAAGATLSDRAGWIDVSWRLMGAGALVVVGGVLVGGAARGRPAGLMGIGAALMISLVAGTVFDVPLGSGLARRDLRPPTVDQLASEYRLTAGTLTLDLSDVASEPVDLDLSLSVWAGSISVVVPLGTEVRVEAGAGLGSVQLFDLVSSGFSADREFESVGFIGAERRVTIFADVGIGRVVVRQAHPELEGQS